jgi:hypothetical protein
MSVLLSILLSLPVMISGDDRVFALLFPVETRTSVYWVNDVEVVQYQHRFDLKPLAQWPDANAISVVERDGDGMRSLGYSIKPEGHREYLFSTTSTNDVGILVWHRARERAVGRLGVGDARAVTGPYLVEPWGEDGPQHEWTVTGDVQIEEGMVTIRGPVGAVRLDRPFGGRLRIETTLAIDRWPSEPETVMALRSLNPSSYMSLIRVLPDGRLEIRNRSSSTRMISHDPLTIDLSMRLVVEHVSGPDGSSLVVECGNETLRIEQGDATEIIDRISLSGFADDHSEVTVGRVSVWRGL